jgi:hypothetical protein
VKAALDPIALRPIFSNGLPLSARSLRTIFLLQAAKPEIAVARYALT